MDKKSTGFHIVLVEPEIPGNTGNISRLCAATGCKLHLVRPLGFSTDDKHLKRAGLDYWSLLEIYYHDKFADLQALYPEGRFFCHTTKTTKFHSDVSFQNGDFLVFFAAKTKTESGQILDYPFIPLYFKGRGLSKHELAMHSG